MDYRNTLNLPKTTFSMKANLVSLEPKILSFWNEIGIYQRLREERSKKKKFILHDGPPYANGLIHIGHALNKILKDIVIKIKGMLGYDTPFIVGWDCHGLPVEHQLFKELNRSKSEVSVVDFRKKARHFALKYVDLQKEDFKRLGVFSDWEKPYLTLSSDYEYWVLHLLKELVSSGYVYRGRRPVNWCIKCETALAEAEVEYADKESPSIYFLFKVINSKGKFDGDNVYFLIWTTTPWTLISNVAVAVHPDLDYGVYDYNGKSILFAVSLRGYLEEKLGIALKEKKIFRGKDLELIVLSHPFMGRESLVVNADFVSKEEGSGCVHIAPGHGQEDFSLVKKYNLEIIMPLNEKGVFTDEAGKFSDKDIEEASNLVIEELRKKDLLLKYEHITHSYPHCWRCKNPIVFRATYQWFLDIEHDDLRQRSLKSIESVKWVPSSGIERMRSMLMTRPDWCLSRQRLWGIPIPAVKCKKCGNIVLDEKVIDKAASVFRIEGSDSWFIKDISYFLPDGFKCSDCEGGDFDKENDILDVWFESGASFLAVVKSNEDLRFPADMYLEGSDQHRGWFQVSLIPSVARYNEPPFNTILTHGFVVDGEGRKMSKSLGNVISPQEIIKKYGAEILRLWVAFSDYSEDIKLSNQIIKQLIDIYRKIRNTLRFIMGNLYDFNEDRDLVEEKELKLIDRYMLYKTKLFVSDVIRDYEDFSFYKVAQKVFNFCNLDLSSFYLDILKDRLYTYSPTSKERKSAQNVLYYTFKVLLRVIAPILSFTAEDAFVSFDNWKDKKESIFLHSLAQEKDKTEIDRNVIVEGDRILALRDEVLKEIERKREKGIIGSSLEAEVNIYCEEKDYVFFKKHQDTLREAFIVSGVRVEKGNFRIEVNKAEGRKCLRCWNWRKDVGSDKDYPDLCIRCVNVLKGGGNVEKKDGNKN